MTTRVTQTVGGDEAGFSLIETLIAMAILATGLLSLAGVFILGLSQLAGASSSLIAREKAREAVESVHTARDIRTHCLVRDSQRRVRAECRLPERSRGRVSCRAASRSEAAGDDGLVNTDDDEGVERPVGPGADGVLGNCRRCRDALVNYRRQIEITDIVPNGAANPNLRRLRVTVI